MSGQPLSEDREFEEDEGCWSRNSRMKPHSRGSRARVSGQRRPLLLKPRFSTTSPSSTWNEIGAKPLLTPAEEAVTARAMRAGDFNARQKMIEHNLRLV